MTALRRWRWVALGTVGITAVAALGVWLTGPRSGGLMDPAATGPDGAYALVSLLTDRDVEVVVADTVADVERSARPDTLVLVAQTARIGNDELLQRLARTPGDRLLVQPSARAREALAPRIRSHGIDPFSYQPGCDLREAQRAGSVDLGTTQAYVAIDGQPTQSCYGGALIRYRTGNSTITVVGTTSFLTNSGLPVQGNAALAMNLTGSRPQLIWYAPQHADGDRSATATVSDLVPRQVSWLILQLGLAVLLAALWKARRLGPLVAEQLPVVVRASETVEGLGRLYRSRRARDRAAQALRTALLQRLSPRLGLSAAASPPEVVAAVAERAGTHPEPMAHLLFGPPPRSDDDLLHLARALDDIERKVAAS